MVNRYEIKAPRPLRPPPTQRQEKLTPRQLEVLALLCEGLPNKLIARRLDMASGTVKVHIVRILRALNVSSRLQAAITATRQGLLDKPDNAAPAPMATVNMPLQSQVIAQHVRLVDNAAQRVPAANAERSQAVSAA